MQFRGVLMFWSVMFQLCHVFSFVFLQKNSLAAKVFEFGEAGKPLAVALHGTLT